MTDKPESYVSVTQGSIERSRIERLEAALEFYADIRNYARVILGYNNKSGAVHGDHAIDIDLGNRARAALRKE